MIPTYISLWNHLPWASRATKFWQRKCQDHCQDGCHYCWWWRKQDWWISLEVDRWGVPYLTFFLMIGPPHSPIWQHVHISTGLCCNKIMMLSDAFCTLPSLTLWMKQQLLQLPSCYLKILVRCHRLYSFWAKVTTHIHCGATLACSIAYTCNGLQDAIQM